MAPAVSTGRSGCCTWTPRSRSSPGRTGTCGSSPGTPAGRPGQLQAEIAEGMWHVLGADYADVFGTEPLDLWRRVLRRQKSELALFSTWLEDPDLN